MKHYLLTWYGITDLRVGGRIKMYHPERDF